MEQRKVTIRRIPYGAMLIDEDGKEWPFMARIRIMRRIGAMLDEAGEIEIRFNVKSADETAGVNS